MAAAIRIASQVRGRLGLLEVVRNFSPTVQRGLSTPATGGSSEPKQQPETESKKETWLSNFFVRRIDPGHESHSSQLSDQTIVYELQIHSVKPECIAKYLGLTKDFVKLLDTKPIHAELVGGWTVDIGEQDEAIHLWRYHGYKQFNDARTIHRSDQDFVDFRNARNTLLQSRKNQILLAFSYWGGINPRPGNNIYELRSYVLKPGTMIEWGNYWAKGIKHRQEYGEATAGFFSHIGDLYVAHHLWAYENLEMREQVRDYVWEKPGWADCVRHTVPLIRHMTSRILVPTPYSPLT